MGKVIGILVVALVLFWIIAQPTGAASTVQAVLGGLGTAADHVVLFLRNLV